MAGWPKTALRGQNSFQPRNDMPGMGVFAKLMNGLPPGRGKEGTAMVGEMSFRNYRKTSGVGMNEAGAAADRSKQWRHACQAARPLRQKCLRSLPMRCRWAEGRSFRCMCHGQSFKT
jgi:hypothetical protein